MNHPSQPFDPKRRRFHGYLLAAAATGLLPGCGNDTPQVDAQVAMPGASGEPGEGIDWVAISPPQPGETPGKIEVLEFFSYGCIHCSNFNPLIARWELGLGDDVVLRRVPVTFGRAAWTNLAKLYYTLESLGELERLDQAVFDAIHEEKAALNSEREIADWAARNGIDAERFAATFDGFPMRNRIARADALARDYRVESVPLITVAGRYAVVGREARRLEDLLVIADDLIRRARGNRA